MNISVESIKDQIPFYLTQEAKGHLVKALNSFPKDIDYYLDNYHTECLQGDGWTSLDIFNFDTGEKNAIKGILLSNSCDISTENSRIFPPKINFAPIISLNKYTAQLKKAGMQPQDIENKMREIKNQTVTGLFYLPKWNTLEEDFVALLDDIHTVPLENFIKNNGRSKFFTLSQVGFYLFLMKISIHFCRFHEKLDRSKTAT